MPIKKSDPERPIIPIAIGPHIFQEAIYDFKASVSIMPKVIYDKHTSIRVQPPPRITIHY
jgi:hypothetical protein